MQLTVTTWNINSVRLRIDLRRQVHQGGAAGRPVPAGDQVSGRPVSAQALQASRLRACRAQRPEGLSRRRGALAPAVRELQHAARSAARPTAATSRVVLGERAGLRDPITLHNFYVPAGGDVPDPQVNPKFAHKLVVPRRDARLRASCAATAREPHDPGRRPQRRAARARRVEPQADAARGLAHPDRMREARRRAEGRRLGRRHAHAACRSRPSSTRGGATARPTGRPPTRAAASITSGWRPRSPIASPACRSHKNSRGWTRPSDHVPVTATLEV